MLRDALNKIDAAAFDYNRDIKNFLYNVYKELDNWPLSKVKYCLTQDDNGAIYLHITHNILIKFTETYCQKVLGENCAGFERCNYSEEIGSELIKAMRGLITAANSFSKLSSEVTK